MFGGWLETVAAARSSRYAGDYVVPPDFAPIPYLAGSYRTMLFYICHTTSYVPCHTTPPLDHPIRLWPILIQHVQYNTYNIIVAAFCAALIMALLLPTVWPVYEEP